MIPFNPGNLLKFHNFNARSWQRHRQAGQDVLPFGLKCPDNRLTPFQVFRSVGAGSVSWRLINAVNDTGFISMSAGLLSVAQKTGGGFWVTYLAASNIGPVIPCGFWYVELTIDEALFYSEVMYVYSTTVENQPVFRFTFDNATDKGNVLYQTGYKQYFYPTVWAWDRSETTRDIDTSVDGNGNQTTKFTRTTDRFRLEVADIPDYCLAFFSKCGDLDTVEFQDVGATILKVNMENTDFESRPQGKGLNIGIFTFDAEVESFNGCQENFILA